MDQDPSSQAPMFEHYTERARRVLFFARYEAGRAGSPAVEPEHLLLALMREGKGLSARIFERARVCAGRGAEGDRKPDDPPGGGLERGRPTAQRVDGQVLEFAAQESDRLLHNYVGTEHLLLGVFREAQSLAASILAERGLQINQVREDIVMLLCAPPMPPVRQTKPDIPPSTEVTIKPTDRRPHEGVSARRASDYWVVEGIPLKDMLSRLHDIRKERIELPLSLDDDRRYDFLFGSTAAREPRNDRPPDARGHRQVLSHSRRGRSPGHGRLRAHGAEWRNQRDANIARRTGELWLGGHPDAGVRAG